VSENRVRPARFQWSDCLRGDHSKIAEKHRLTTLEVAVGLALDVRMGKGGACYMSNTEIAWRAKCERETAIRARDRLIKKGWLIKRKSTDGIHANRYQACFPPDHEALLEDWQRVVTEDHHPPSGTSDPESPASDRGSPEPALTGKGPEHPPTGEASRKASTVGGISLSKRKNYKEDVGKRRRGREGDGQLDQDSELAESNSRTAGGDVPPWHDLRRRVEEAES
jgi:hypothetical protein